MADIDGTAHDEILTGTPGDDRIFGHDGDDSINGDDTVDTLRGGHDRIWGNRGDDTILGGRGNDTIWGGRDDDLIMGGPGNDEISGDLGNDSISGEDGDDSLVGRDGDDTIIGDDGSDTVNGADFIHGNAGSDSLAGGAGDDTIRGGKDADDLSGNAGDDLLYGDLGDDSVHGDAGSDSVFGGDGADVLSGGHGADLLHGNVGNDTLYGDVFSGRQPSGRADRLGDTIHGGKDDDLIVGGADSVNVSEASGDISIIDWLYGDLGDDTIWAGNGSSQEADGIDDTLRVTRTTTDEQEMTLSTVSATINVDYGNRLDGGEGNDVLIGDRGEDSLFGGEGNDVLVDNAGADELHGGSGNDTLYGSSTWRVGVGTYSGGDDARDVLSGGGGDDVLYGALDLDVDEADALNGGDGADRLHAFWDAADNPSPARLPTFADIVASTDNVALTMTGGSGNDTFDLSGVEFYDPTAVIRITDYQSGDKVWVDDPAVFSSITVVNSSDDLSDVGDAYGNYVVLEDSVLVQFVGVSSSSLDTVVFEAPPNG